MDVFGTDAEGDLVADGRAGYPFGIDVDAEVGRLEAAFVERPLREVHRRRANEAGDEQVRRLVVTLEGRRDLLEFPGVEDGDAVGHRHCLGLVVGDVDDRRPQFAVESLELRAHVHSELRVQVGEWLVHQEDVGVAHDGAGDRDPLALSAGHLVGHPIEHTLELDDVGGLFDAPLDLLVVVRPQPEAEGDVLEDVHVGKQRDVLEDHRDAPILRSEGRHVVVADVDPAVGRLGQSGDGLHRRRLPTARGADEGDELAVFDLHAHVVDRRDVFVLLRDVLESYSCHCILLLECARGQSADDLLLGHDHEDRDRDHADNARGGHQVVHDLVLALIAENALENRCPVLRLAVGHQKREEELVVDGDEGEDARRGDAGGRQRDDDPEQRAESRGSLHAGGILQSVGDLAVEGRQNEDGQRHEDRRQREDHRARRVIEGPVARDRLEDEEAGVKEVVQRDEKGRWREKGDHQHEHHHRDLPRELEAAEGVAREARDDQDDDRRGRRDDEAVEHVPVERQHLEDLDEGAGVEPVRRKDDVLLLSLGGQRDHEQPVEGKQRRDQEEDGRGVEHRPVGPLGVLDGVGGPALERSAVEFGVVAVLAQQRVVAPLAGFPAVRSGSRLTAGSVAVARRLAGPITAARPTGGPPVWRDVVRGVARRLRIRFGSVVGYFLVGHQ
ncbi:phenol hydroxylase [Natronolimnohabitans innermongolicus JCM 12255]|uniref:Phenol hydroxylase n=1 Tax=Natronolimnohabitans innermongolicus JCM 12255 TaxID=1227499 RepID=L9XNF2_9EURY|nr:phenol hydroxylase [Natronolimnohabitans innermongolicus JCM 12255]